MEIQLLLNIVNAQHSTIPRQKPAVEQFKNDDPKNRSRVDRKEKVPKVSLEYPAFLQTNLTNHSLLTPSNEIEDHATKNTLLSIQTQRTAPYLPNPQHQSNNSATSRTTPARRSRSIISGDKLMHLRHVFQINKFPDTEYRQELADLLQVPSKVIQSKNNFIIFHS